MGFVLDLGIRERSAIAQAPVHGLLAFVDQPPFDKLAERTDDVGLEGVVHREIRMLPVTEHAEPFEVGTLRGHELRCKLPARAAEVADGLFLGRWPELALDIE